MNSSRLTTLIALWSAMLLSPWTSATRAETHAFYQLVVSPAHHGQIAWSTTAPPANGVVDSNGTVKVDSTARITFTFSADPGYYIKAETVNGTDYSHYGNTFFFDPARSSHTVGLKVALAPPTGTFSFPAANNTAITPIFDISGHYSGNTQTSSNRHYEIDVAVDPDGKIQAFGTLNGITQTSLRARTLASTGPLGGTVGSLFTDRGVPTANYHVKFEGTRDDQDATVNGSVSAPLTLYTSGSDNTVQGRVTYKSNVGGVPFRERNAPLTVVVTPADKAKLNNKAWTFNLTVTSGTNAQGHTFFKGSAALNMQNGDAITFPARPVKYSAAKGFTLKFRKGTNSATAAVEPSVKIAIKRLTMEKQNNVWVPTGGTLSYQFLGQKGSGALTSFGP